MVHRVHVSILRSLNDTRCLCGCGVSVYVEMQRKRERKPLRLDFSRAFEYGRRMSDVRLGRMSHAFTYLMS